MKKPRYELEKYENQRITVTGVYESYCPPFKLFKNVTLSDGTVIDHVNLKSEIRLKYRHSYKIEGTIVKYKSPQKVGGVDWGFSQKDLKITPIEQ